MKNHPATPKSIGFTLIELMIVISIVGILAAIAIPKFADLVRKSQEGQLKGSLGSLRSALNVYYTDMEGLYPGIPNTNAILNYSLQSLTINGKYLSALPTVRVLPYHVFDGVNYEIDTSSVYLLPQLIAMGGEPVGAPLFFGTTTWPGVWYYYGDPTYFDFGHLFIGCQHTDSLGTLWTSY